MTYTCQSCNESARGCGSREQRQPGERVVQCVDCGGEFCMCCCRTVTYIPSCDRCPECLVESVARRREYLSQRVFHVNGVTA